MHKNYAEIKDSRIPCRAYIGYSGYERNEQFYAAIYLKFSLKIINCSMIKEIPSEWNA